MKKNERVEGKRFGEERALYGSRDLSVVRCRFEGEEDGESALKESRRIEVSDCFFALRYPFWHDTDLVVRDSEMTETCRAPFWYDRNVTLDGCVMHGVKAFRECRGVDIRKSDVVSPELGWNCRKITVLDSKVSGEYAFFRTSDVKVSGMTFAGKYSFQYSKNVEVGNSVFQTKDAFWHTKNVTVRNSEIRGEYLGWYSENLTLIECRISGTQPFCYCRNLTLIDCETEGCDLAFEYSSVNAVIRGDVLSIKNPRAGRIECDSVGAIIRGNTVVPCDCEIIVGGRKK